MDADDISRLKVILGAHDIYNPFESGRIEMSASQVAFHKGFDSIDMVFIISLLVKKQSNIILKLYSIIVNYKENNIALVRLQKPINYSNLIQPICLSNTSIINDRGNELATVAGFGQMLFDPLKYLNKLDLRTWPNIKCAKRYTNDNNNVNETIYFPKIREDNLCASSFVTPTNSLCQVIHYISIFTDLLIANNFLGKQWIPIGNATSQKIRVDWHHILGNRIRLLPLCIYTSR